MLYIFNLAVDIYIAIVIVQVLVTWLIAFDVINASNEQAKNLMELLKKATEPAYKPLRKYVPPIGGVDITPLVLIILISIFRAIVNNILT